MVIVTTVAVANTGELNPSIKMLVAMSFSLLLRFPTTVPPFLQTGKFYRLRLAICYFVLTNATGLSHIIFAIHITVIPTNFRWQNKAEGKLSVFDSLMDHSYGFATTDGKNFGEMRLSRGPIMRCSLILLIVSGDPMEKHHMAAIKKQVVGNIGTNMPAAPVAIDNQPS